MRPETLSAMARIMLLTFAALARMEAPSAAQCGPLPGDSNGNQHVELVDHSDFVNCLAGPAATPQPEPPLTPESCLTDFDVDADFDTDLLDFAEFQSTFTGPIRPECFNVAFVSSAGLQPNLGSAQAYDTQCNVLASSAGLNNPAGNAFVAWVSTTNSLARDRLGSARGFLRPDGLPVADTINDLLANYALLNPIRVDEFGNDVGALVMMTGTQANGTASPSTCSNWTMTSGAHFAGSSAGGPGLWTQNSSSFCNQGPFRIYCFQKTFTRALTPPKWPGKVIYLSNSLFTPGNGLAAADQLCTSDKPAGTGPVRALLATSGVSAASLLLPFDTYVRVDGQVVGTVTELTTANLLRSGIWQTGNGSYLPGQLAWTGSSSFASVGTLAGTCNNWASATASLTGITGLPHTTQGPLWWNYFTRSCAIPQRLYCVER